MTKGENNERAIWLLAALALVTFASAQDAFSSASPQSSLPISEFPSLTPVSLIPSLSMAPSSLGVPTIVAPPIRTFPPAMIPPQPTPTAISTIAPTAAATAPPTEQLVDTEGLVYVTLFYVTDAIPENYVDAYERQCAVFFSDKLRTLTDPISGITCSMVDQEIVPNESESRLRGRGLQADTTRLLTLLNVQGNISEAAGSPSDINLILRFAVLNDPEGFAETLRDATDTGFYFEQVETVEAFDPESFTPYPTVSPPVSQAEDDSGLKAPGIIAIVIGIVASAIIASAVTFFIMRGNQANAVGAASPKSGKKQDSAPEVVRAQAVPLAHVESVPPPAKVSPSTTNNTNETLAMEDDISITANGDNPDKAIDDIPFSANEDIPPTASDDVSLTANQDILLTANDTVDQDITFTENDDIPFTTNQDIPLTANDEITAKDDIPFASNDDTPVVEDDDLLETDDDDFPVTASTSVMESEGADALSYAYSLDAGNVDSQTGERIGESTIGGDMSTEVSVRPNMTSREVIAPPGKLGIVIDTTLEGPVVHKVNPGSALEDKVYPGDIIVAIDDVDTRAMSASAITALMVKTANQQRRLTVLSEEGPVEP